MHRSCGERKLTCKLLSTSPVIYMRSIVILLNALTCALRSTFYDGLGEKRHEFADGTSLIK